MSDKTGIAAIIISLASLCCFAVCLVFALTANGSTDTGSAVTVSADTAGTCKQFVIFDDVDKDTVYKAADEVIKRLNQNSVLIEEDEISIDYYSGKQ